MIPVQFVLMILCMPVCFGHHEYQLQIPNGASVPNPCRDDRSIWGGVGHYAPGGAGPRNPFGLDFASEGHVWTHNLCMKDSDGDGNSNGMELGDPRCHWSVATASTAHLTAASGHPGICEPMASAVCLKANNATALRDTCEFYGHIPAGPGGR